MGAEKRKSVSDFVLEANTIHNNKYDYTKVIYTNRNNKVTITCPIHGDFEQTPNGHLKGYGCYACGRNKTEVVEYLVSKGAVVDEYCFDHATDPDLKNL